MSLLPFTAGLHLKAFGCVEKPKLSQWCKFGMMALECSAWLSNLAQQFNVADAGHILKMKWVSMNMGGM